MVELGGKTWQLGRPQDPARRSLQPGGEESRSRRQEVGALPAGYGPGQRRGEHHFLSQRRGCSRCPKPLHPGPADGGQEAVAIRRLHGTEAAVRINRSAVLLLLAGALLLSGCSHRSARVNVPPPPSIPESTPPAPSPGTESNIPSPSPEPPAVPQPAFVETGTASWYGPPSHNRRASDGEIYNMNALTAAHRTLPLGSIVRVTNVRTHHSVVVRVTDRWPFIPGRIIDLSLAAAKAVDVWRPGLATVRMELLKTP